MEPTTIEARVRDAERRLTEIDRLVHVPTSSGTSAYTLRDFDRIRGLTLPWHIE